MSAACAAGPDGDGERDRVQEIIDAARLAPRPGEWFWSRALETGMVCRMCEKRKLVWIDSGGLAWSLCRACDVDPSNPPRRRCGS